MKKVLVVGASGVVGNLICSEILRIFEHDVSLNITDYIENRGKELAQLLGADTRYHFLDVKKAETVAQVIKEMDLVIVALNQQYPLIQKACIDNGIICLDITPYTSLVDKVYLMQQDAVDREEKLVVMAGFFPGLSGLMVKHAITNFQRVDEVHIGLLQNTNAKAGLAGIIDMLKIISQPVIKTSGFKQMRKMPFSIGEREVRLIDHAEKRYLKDKFKIGKINYWTAWNNSFFNKMIYSMKQVGLIHWLTSQRNNNILAKLVKHNPAKAETTFLTVEVKGSMSGLETTKIVTLTTFSDYHTTAMATAALAKIALRKSINGVMFPFEFTTLDEVVKEMKCDGKMSIKEVLS